MCRRKVCYFSRKIGAGIIRGLIKQQSLCSTWSVLINAIGIQLARPSTGTILHYGQERLSSRITARIIQIYRTIIVIRKHISPNESLPCALIIVRINKSPVCGIIITRLQVVESCLIIIIVSAIPQRIDCREVAAAVQNIAPRIVSILRNNMSICLNQLDNVALQVQDIVIGIKGSAIGGIFQCKRLSRLIIDEIKDRCQGVIRFNCLSGNFSVQCKILMRDRLRSGDMGSLRGDGFIFSRNVRLDRFALAALAVVQLSKGTLCIVTVIHIPAARIHHPRHSVKPVADFAISLRCTGVGAGTC